MSYIGSKPADKVLTASDITDGVVSNAKLAQDIISADTALASEPADTDEFLVSDAGTLKRIDYSLIKGGGITEVDQWRISANHSGVAVITSNWERVDTYSYGGLGTGMSESSGIFTFPQTGIYLVDTFTHMYLNSNSRYNELAIQLSTDGGSNYSVIADGYTSISRVDNQTTYASVFTKAIIDVTNASNFKVSFKVTHHTTATTVAGNSSVNNNASTFIRLGDT